MSRPACLSPDVRRSARLVAALLAVALAVVGLAFVPRTTAEATPTTVVPVTDATLTWKISDCAFDGSGCTSLWQSQSVISGAVTRVSGSSSPADDGWTFAGGTGTYDASTGASTVSFIGTIEIGNSTQGGYRIRFADPVVTVDSTGAGTLAADVSYNTTFTSSPGSPFSTPVNAVLVSLPAVPNATSWTVTPPWTGVGTPGANNTTPVDGAQFAQPLLDALAPATPSLLGWFRKTGTTGTNLLKAPAPVGLSMTIENVVDATMTWGLHACAFTQPTISGCTSLTQTQSVSGLVTRGTTGWELTGGTGSYDATTGALDVGFTGSFEIGNSTQGNYRIRFADPVVTVDSTGAGELAADVGYSLDGGSTYTTTQDVVLVSLPSVPNATSWSVTPPWTGVGTPGANNTTPVDGAQFAQTLLDALAPAQPSLLGWFRKTGTTGTNLYKAPSPVDLAITLVQTGSSSSPSSTASPSPTSTSSPSSSPLPTAPALGGGGGIPGGSSASTARPVTGGSLSWGIKGAFTSYVTGGIANGTVSTSGGASGGFVFPVTGGTYDPATGQGVLRFGGSVHFVGHSGQLDVTVSNPQLHFGPSGSALYGGLTSKHLQTGQVGNFSGLIASVSGSPTVSGDTIAIPGRGTSLGSDAAPAFGGFYSAGTAFDTLGGSVTLGRAGTATAASTADATTTTAASLTKVDGTPKDASTTSVRLTRASYVFGQVARAVVTVSSSGAPASGSVTLTAAGRTVTGTLDGGAAVLTVPAVLNPGRHALTIAYGGSDDALPSSTSASVRIAKAEPALAWRVTSSKGRPQVRASVTIPGAADSDARGVVVVTSDGKEVATGRLNVNGIASLSLPSSVSGTERLTVLVKGNLYQQAVKVARTVTIDR